VRTLLLGLLEDPDHLVQGACYAALVRLLTNAIHTAIPERFSLETDVDWGVLRPEIERFGLNEGQNWAQRLESALVGAGYRAPGCSSLTEFVLAHVEPFDRLVI